MYDPCLPLLFSFDIRCDLSWCICVNPVLHRLILEISCGAESAHNLYLVYYLRNGMRFGGGRGGGGVYLQFLNLSNLN